MKPWIRRCLYRLAHFYGFELSLLYNTYALYISVDYALTCYFCERSQYHEKTEKIMVLPEVLIVYLKRFPRSLYGRSTRKNDTPVDPPNILSLSDQTDYFLRSIITHHGQQVNNGHVTVTLNTSQGLILCNDLIVFCNGKCCIAFL